ncbi:MAG: YqgE/AlgH family protein [Rhodospirillales bacterium]
MTTEPSTGYLTGQMLIAMPQMQDPRFARTVIYMCAHTADGAMGLVVNKLIESVSFSELLEQLNIDRPGGKSPSIRVHFGGPVETGRGFVLHSADYAQEATLVINDRIALTATVDILKAMAQGKGPSHSLLALGYAGWGPGQLDSEMQQNGWLCVPADDKLIFGTNLDSRWEDAMQKLGISLHMLSGEAGRA